MLDDSDTKLRTLEASLSARVCSKALATGRALARHSPCLRLLVSYRTLALCIQRRPNPLSALQFSMKSSPTKTSQTPLPLLLCLLHAVSVVARCPSGR